MTSTPKLNDQWTKDKAGAFLAATTGLFFTDPPALETTKQLVPDYAHTVAWLVSCAVAVLAYWVGLGVMRKLP
ncbi:hypothetical protein ACWC09_02820 [Streptomyces sp. NPDC001617]